MSELKIIKDYAPNLNINKSDSSSLNSSNSEMTEDCRYDHLSEMAEVDRHIPDFYNPLDYFDEITSLSKLDVRHELKENSIPVPMDYFKRDPLHKLRQVLTKPEEIMNSQIAGEYNLHNGDLAVNEENYPEVEKYLFGGQPTEITPHSIKSGVIGAGENFLVLVGSPNKHGYPGRLFILYTEQSDSYIEDDSSIYNVPETPLNMEAGLLRANYRNRKDGHLFKDDIKQMHPLEYHKTMRDISHYDQSLIGQTLESIEGLREIFSNFFMAPSFEKKYSAKIYDI